MTYAASDAGQITGRYHSIETCGTVDGPGIRYILFLQGCPLRCSYCHNPDTWAAGGKEISVSQVVNDAKKYRSYMQASGGGITVTGGEPLMQPDFVAALFAACRKEGIHTALDTSGCVSSAWIRKVTSVTDLALLDLKASDEGTFRSLTGGSRRRTREAAQIFAEEGVGMWLRYVVVPGITDDMESARELADFSASLGPAVERVEILPFHQLGEYKWKELGLEYKLKGVSEPAAGVLEKIRQEFSKRGLTVS